jgi:hypothetical protein
VDAGNSLNFGCAVVTTFEKFHPPSTGMLLAIVVVVFTENSAPLAGTVGAGIDCEKQTQEKESRNIDKLIFIVDVRYKIIALLYRGFRLVGLYKINSSDFKLQILQSLNLLLIYKAGFDFCKFLSQFKIYSSSAEFTPN